MIYSHK